MIAGTIVDHYSFNVGFLFLAAIAALAFIVLYFFMPETRENRFLKEHL
jgi:predicted MFS family arabinose efflux permease